MSVDDKVTTGERVRLRAAAWNTMVDAAAAWRANQLGGGATDGLDLEAASATVCRIKNITGSLLPRRSVLAVSDSLRDATDPELRNTIEFTGSAPTAGDEGRWCVLREHAPANGTAEAVIAGVAHVDVNVVSSSHGFAELEPGRTDRLISGETGSAKIIWIGGTSGVQPAVVRILGPIPPAKEFMIRNEYSNLTAGRGLELGQLYSAGVVKANLRSDCSRAYAILAEDIAVNTIGQAKVTGWATARVNVLKTEHTHAYLPPSATVFKTGFGGPLELAQTPTATGEQDILVRWQPLYRRRVRLNDTMLANNFADCNFYGGALLGTVLGSDNVYFNWMKGAVSSIAYGVEGWSTWDDGICVWILDAAECS